MAEKWTSARAGSAAATSASPAARARHDRRVPGVGWNLIVAPPLIIDSFLSMVPPSPDSRHGLREPGRAGDQPGVIDARADAVPAIIPPVPALAIDTRLTLLAHQRAHPAPIHAVD